MRIIKLSEFEITVRDETPEDVQVIAAITRAAFEHHPFSRQTEEFIVSALRRAGDLTLSLVADLKGEVVGHVAFSPVDLGAAGSWFGVGPLSVRPDRQRRGIGKALMTEGLRLLRLRQAAGCVLVGDPDYYKQFGFSSFPGLPQKGGPRKTFRPPTF